MQTIIFTLLLFFGLGASGAESFEDGIRLFQEGNFAEAAKTFSELPAEQRNTPSNLFNWGLAAYNADQKGLALGLWRKALDVAPSLSQATAALKAAEQSLSREAFNMGDSTAAIFKYQFLRSIPIDSLLVLHFLLLAFAGWLLINFYLQRRESLIEEKPMPNFPMTSGIFVVLFLITTAGLALKYSLNSEARATVISNDLVLRTAASETSNPLFQTVEGMEFLITNVSGPWARITHPSGMTGWAPTSKLLQNSGEPLW